MVLSIPDTRWCLPVWQGRLMQAWCFCCFTGALFMQGHLSQACILRSNNVLTLTVSVQGHFLR